MSLSLIHISISSSTPSGPTGKAPFSLPRLSTVVPAREMCIRDSYEPLNAWLTTQVGGRCVRLDVSREETFQNTRSRHPISFDVAAAVDGDMRLMARSCTAVSNQGGYASHGHSIVANAVTGFRQLLSLIHI